MTDEQLPTAPLPAVRADSVRQENQPQPELPVEAEEEKTASLADPGEAGEEKTASLTNPGEAREEANSLLPAHLAELTAEETLLLPAFQPGINVGREAHGPSSQPGIGVERAPYAPISQAGVHVGLPASWSGIIIEEMPWPQAAPPGRTPMPASLAGISAEETPLPLGYTQEIEREKTVLLPVPQWRKLPINRPYCFVNTRLNSDLSIGFYTYPTGTAGTAFSRDPPGRNFHTRSS